MTRGIRWIWRWVSQKLNSAHDLNTERKELKRFFALGEFPNVGLHSHFWEKRSLFAYKTTFKIFLPADLPISVLVTFEKMPDPMFHVESEIKKDVILFLMKWNNFNNKRWRTAVFRQLTQLPAPLFATAFALVLIVTSLTSDAARWKKNDGTFGLNWTGPVV